MTLHLYYLGGRDTHLGGATHMNIVGVGPWGWTQLNLTEHKIQPLFTIQRFIQHL